MLKNYYRHKVLVAAHRGNSRYFPENTMPAFESALNMDIDMIETDLHMTKDGEIVMIHDSTVDRTTNGTGAVCDLTLAELRKLDAGSWKDARFKGTKIPTFLEFLELVKDRRDLMFNIELKDYPAEQGERAYESCNKIIGMMEEYGISERCVINSWRGKLLEYVDETYKHQYPIHGYYPTTWMGRDLTRDPYEYMYCVCIFDKENIVADKEIFDYVISRGAEPWIYFEEESPEQYKKAVERGAVAITSNDPQRTIDILENLKMR